MAKLFIYEDKFVVKSKDGLSTKYNSCEEFAHIKKFHKVYNFKLAPYVGPIIKTNILVSSYEEIDIENDYILVDMYDYVLILNDEKNYIVEYCNFYDANIQKCIKKIKILYVNEFLYDEYTFSISDKIVLNSDIPDVYIQGKKNLTINFSDNFMCNLPNLLEKFEHIENLQITYSDYFGNYDQNLSKITDYVRYDVTKLSIVDFATIDLDHIFEKFPNLVYLSLIVSNKNNSNFEKTVVDQYKDHIINETAITKFSINYNCYFHDELCQKESKKRFVSVKRAC